MSRVWKLGRSVAYGSVYGRRIACLFGIGVVLCMSAVQSAQARPVPNLKFKNLAGHAESLGSLRGKITVVNFWATWCPPCRAEMPMLSRLAQQYAGRGVQFVAISVDSEKDQPKIAPFLKQQKIALPVWVGADLGTLGRLGFGNVVPATLVLDAKDDPVGRIEGEARPADVEGYVNWLLSGRKGKAPAKKIKRY